MAPTMLARTRSRTLSLLLVPLSCLIAAGCGKPADPTPAADGEFQVLVTSKALALTANADPATVSAGGKVTLTAQVTTSRATSIDVVIGVKNASGSSSYATEIGGQPIGPTTPFQFQDALTTAPADPSGTWTLSVTVRHTATGKVLIENASAATFTVTGGSTPGGGGGGGGSGTGACAGSAVFCDDFTNASLKDSYTTSSRGSWVRGTGIYTATDEAEAWQRTRSMLSGDYTDFDVTLQGKSMGAAGFGLSYAAQASDDDGFAVIIHPTPTTSTNPQSVYLKRLVPGGSDVQLAVYPLQNPAAGTLMKLRVRRVGTTVTVSLDDKQIISQDDGGTGRHGKLGLLLSITDQLSGSGAVFSLLRLDQATKYGSACTPQCSGKVCASDGCGGVCDACTGGQTCDTSSWQCTSGSSSGSWLSGSSGDYVMDGSFGKWRGRTVEIAGTWSDNTAENQQGAWSVQESGTFGSWQGPIDLAVGGIFPDEGESWSNAAGGSYDSRWTKTLNNIKAARQGKGTTFIRFAHEFNGDWFWPVTGSTTSDFKKAWIRFYNLKKSIFPESKLVWCPNDGTSGGLDLDVRDAFPGKDYVDVIGVDSYNNWPAAGTAEQFDSKINMEDGKGAPVGIEKWRQFAKDQGLPLAIPEWSGCAIENKSSNTEVAVDYPIYMEQFYAWLKDNAGTGPGQVWYEIIFNIASGFGDDYAPESSGGKYQLYPVTNQPNSAKRYAELW